MPDSNVDPNVDPNAVDPNAVDPNSDPNAVDPNALLTPEYITKEQAGTWMGRIVKKQFDEGVLPILNEIKSGMSKPTENAPDSTLQDLMFTDPDKFFDMGLQRANERQKNLSETRVGQMNTEIQKLSEDPEFKDLYPDITEEARKRIGKGYPIKEAVESAVLAAKVKLLQGKLTPAESLGMLDGGRGKPRTKTVKLTADEEKACARDIRDGIFKTKEEWITQHNR